MIRLFQRSKIVHGLPLKALLAGCMVLAIAIALGGKRREIGAFIWSEAGLVLAGGLVSGAALGWGLAAMLVRLLNSIFDPPPTRLSVPWMYLALVLAATSGAIALAGVVMTRRAAREVLETIRGM